MYCIKCKYTSFDHLDNCPKCGNNWKETKKILNLDWLPPPPETDSSQEPIKRVKQVTEEEVELESDHFLLDSINPSKWNEQETKSTETTLEKAHIEESDYSESEANWELNAADLEIEPESKENIYNPAQSTVSNRQENKDLELNEQSSEDISHPDLEQLLDSYSTESTQNSGEAKEKPLSTVSEHIEEELELFADLEIETDKEDLNQEAINTNKKMKDRTNGENSSNSNANNQNQRQEEEIDITSILDNFEEEDKNK